MMLITKQIEGKEKLFLSNGGCYEQSDNKD